MNPFLILSLASVVLLCWPPARTRFVASITRLYPGLCSMVPVQVLQSIFTLAFDQSRSNTPEPGEVSLQIPCGTP